MIKAKMKALSLKQPFAELVVSGKKKIELRKWKTNFRGEFLIHASKTPDKEAMSKFNFKELPVGCIIGKVNLVDVKEYISNDEHAKDKSLHLADERWGNYGFILQNPIRLNAIKINGKLNFWETNLNP